MDWQPIETAPKDGTIVIAYYPATNQYNDRVMIVRRKSRGWAPAGGGNRTLVSSPTHWMPLPPAPTSPE